MLHGDEIFSRILEKYYSSLTAAEKRIADYILKNPHESVTFSVTSLAERAGTSEATVVRFARTLGFKGFLELKSELLKRASRDLALSPRQEREGGEREKSVQQIVANAEVANINETLSHLESEDFERFVKTLSGASTIYTLGSGMSAFLARMASYQLTIVGKRSVALPETTASYEENLDLACAETDLLWVFSFPPYSMSILKTVEYARGIGLPVVAITDRKISPVVSQAKAALFASNNNILPINSISASLVLLTACLTRLAMQTQQTNYAKKLASAMEAAMASYE